MKKPAPFATEADLCACFIAAIGPNWTAFAETAGWDILLVRKLDGFQVGIEAKLKLNAIVVSQAIEEYGTWDADRSGPDCRAVLVPSESNAGFERICAYIGVTIIRVRAPEPPFRCSASFHPSLPGNWSDQQWHEWAPPKRCRLPEYVPDVPAGASAPVQLTAWKIAAIKIVVTLRRRGFVTRADFKAHSIDHRRWLASESEWLRNEGGRFVAGRRLPDLRAQHPRVYAEIEADADKWMPVAVLPAAQQGALL